MDTSSLLMTVNCAHDEYVPFHVSAPQSSSLHINLHAVLCTQQLEAILMLFVVGYRVEINELLELVTKFAKKPAHLLPRLSAPNRGCTPS